MRERSKGECLAQLECAAGASFEEAKKAYRALAMKCHPDRAPSTAAEERFKKISTAFESLRLRHQEGRWDAKEPALGADPAPAAVRRWRGPEHWNVPIEGPFKFVYLPGGSVAEIARAFYESWAAAAQRAAWGRGGEKAPQSLAMAHLKLFARYAPGLTDEDLPTLASEFARAFWAREAPGSLAVAEKAFARAREEVNDNAWAVVDPINPRIAWRAPAGREPAFSMLDQIATKRESSQGSIRFHQEVAKRFEGLAPIERLDDKGGRKARPWALRLAQARPELFGVYARAGWFDWSHSRYQEDGFARGLIDSAVGWGEKAAPLWRVLGPRGCALALQSMDPEAASEAVQAWEADFIGEGAVDEVAPALQTKAMRKASPLRRAHREVKAKTAPALGRWGLALRRKIGREREAGDRAFAAVCLRDASALREALAQAKAQGEQSAPRIQGTPLAVFAAWSQAFEGSEFAGQAFEALRDFFGEQAMREAGPGSRSGADWEAALASRAPRRRPG